MVGEEKKDKNSGENNVVHTVIMNTREKEEERKGMNATHCGRESTTAAIVTNTSRQKSSNSTPPGGKTSPPL